MTVRDNWPDERASVAIHVEYGDDPVPIEFEADGETAEYTRANDPGCIEECMMFELADESDGPMVKLHVDMNHSKWANHFGTAVEKQMAEKCRFDIERASWHDARFGNRTPVEIKPTMHEHADGQPGNFKVYWEYHEKARRNDGWYCFVVYWPYGRSAVRSSKTR